MRGPSIPATYPRVAQVVPATMPATLQRHGPVALQTAAQPLQAPHPESVLLPPAASDRANLPAESTPAPEAITGLRPTTGAGDSSTLHLSKAGGRELLPVQQRKTHIRRQRPAMAPTQEPAYRHSQLATE